jgi:hypothetical protein
MSFKSETYRVLIASPSDLPEERQAATDAINEWNAQHAGAEGVGTNVTDAQGRRVPMWRPVTGNAWRMSSFRFSPSISTAIWRRAN